MPSESEYTHEVSECCTGLSPIQLSVTVGPIIEPVSGDCIHVCCAIKYRMGESNCTIDGASTNQYATALSQAVL